MVVVAMEVAGFFQGLRMRVGSNCSSDGGCSMEEQQQQQSSREGGGGGGGGGDSGKGSKNTRRKKSIQGTGWLVVLAVVKVLKSHPRLTIAMVIGTISSIAIITTIIITSLITTTTTRGKIIPRPPSTKPAKVD